MRDLVKRSFYYVGFLASIVSALWLLVTASAIVVLLMKATGFDPQEVSSDALLFVGALPLAVSGTVFVSSMAMFIKMDEDDRKREVVD